MLTRVFQGKQDETKISFGDLTLINPIKLPYLFKQTVAGRLYFYILYVQEEHQQIVSSFARKCSVNFKNSVSNRNPLSGTDPIIVIDPSAAFDCVEVKIKEVNSQ